MVERPLESKTLQKYAIAQLPSYPFATSEIKIVRILEETPRFTSYLFVYQTLNKKMSGVLNIPANTTASSQPRVIIMIRGYVAPENYASGTGTKNAATAFANQGYVTISPDFFGYGESDPEFSDEWEARFTKPIEVVELLKTIQQQGIPIDGSSFQQIPTNKIGIWAHSNGGQIALTTLAALSEPLPTTLWAPVTAPFPYSVLFYSDEQLDEGQEARAWVNLFEKKYQAFDFSLPQHLDQLTGPLQLHHGTADEAAPISWSDEFVSKIKVENERRKSEIASSASASAFLAPASLPAISLTYFRYPETDHNLQPNWDTAIARDLTFFATYVR